MAKEAVEEKEPKEELVDVPQEENPAPKKGKKLLIIIIPIVILLLSGGLYFSGLLDRFFNKEKKEEHKTSETTKTTIEAEPIYKPLEGFIVDLKTGSSASFIKIDIILKLPNQKSLKSVEDNTPIIRDSFISYLRELKSTDIYGSEGLFVLKQELLLRINKIISPSTIDDIYIQNILTR